MQRARSLIFSFFLFVTTVSFAQSRLIWSTTSSLLNSQITDPRSFAVDGNGNSYSINYTESALSLYTKYVFYAHDASGVKLWEYENDSCLLDCNDNYFNIIPLENDGAIFIGAYDDITGTQLRIKRIDNQGSLVWQQYWITPFLSIQPVKSMLDNNGHLIVGIKSTVNLTDLEDFCVAKFDTAGGLLDWHIELPDDGTTLNPLSEIISDLTIDGNNNIYCVGTGSNSSVVKNYYFKIDDNGALDYRYENSYDGMNSNNFAIVTDASGHFYTLGHSGTKPYLEKYDNQTGSLIWSEGIEKDSAELTNVGLSIAGNDIYVANNFTYFNSGGTWDNKHYLLNEINSSGNLQWQRGYFTETDSLALQDGFGGAVQFGLCDAGLYVLSAQHLDPLNNILILHRVDLSGTTVWYDTASIEVTPGFMNFDHSCDIYLTRPLNDVNLTEKYTTSPLSTIETTDHFSGISIFPNPSEGEFTISLTEEVTGSTYAVIYNSLGEEVKSTLISTGITQISISDFPSGIYLVQIRSNGKQQAVKTILKQ